MRNRNSRKKRISEKTALLLLASALFFVQLLMPAGPAYAADKTGSGTTSVQASSQHEAIQGDDSDSGSAGSEDKSAAAKDKSAQDKQEKTQENSADSSGSAKTSGSGEGSTETGDKSGNEAVTEEAGQRRVVFRAVDSDGNTLEKYHVLVEKSLDARTWAMVSPDEGDSENCYTLPVRDKNENLYVTYRFTVMSKGYTPFESQKFTFGRQNPYFNPDDPVDPVEISVKMTLSSDTLKAAQDKAVRELQAYRDLSGYREAEQKTLQDEIESGSEKIRKAATVNSVEYELKTAKERIDRIKTKQQYEDEEARDRIYFQSDDGKTVVRPSKYGTVTLTTIDSGTFHISRADGTDYANDDLETDWDCTWQYTEPDHGDIAWNVIIGSYGQYQGRFVGTYDASVTIRDTGQKIHFKVKITDGHIDRLRAIIDGEDMSGSRIHVMGSEKKRAKIEGRLYGTDRWVSIPDHAVKCTPGGSTSVSHVTGIFRTWGTSGSMTYSLVSRPGVRTTVDIRATIVHPESVEVTAPKEAYVDDWDGAFGQYVGIRQGQGAGWYQVRVYPENTSNPGVKWTDLTPDIATFQEKHSAGIVPKKAGTAKFRVTCVDNPKASTIVTVRFKYLKPLRTAVPEKAVYYAKSGDSPIPLVILTNGERNSVKGASEQRFHWSYSTSGVASVKDSVHYDPSSVTIPRWVEHSITILGDGVVYVTGKPYDTTGGCRPVHFKVIVSSSDNIDRSAVDRVEQMINAIGVVTLDKKGQIKDARAAFNALSQVQKGMVDENVYSKLVAAELRLRELLRQQNPNHDGDDNNGGSGNNSGADSGGGSSGTDGSGTIGGARSPEGRSVSLGSDKSDAAIRTVSAVSASESELSAVPGAESARRQIYREVDIDKVRAKKRETKRERQLAEALLIIIAAIFTGGAVWRFRTYQHERG